MLETNAKGAIHLVGTSHGKVVRYDLGLSAIEASYREAWGRVERREFVRNAFPAPRKTS